MIQFMIVLLMLLIGHPLASAQNAHARDVRLRCDVGTACGVMDCP